MAANDPSFDVPTPKGVLQGVAVFNWDGSQWQPRGKAATEVATPTGILRGVAAFTGGPNWSPAARAQTEVPTPSGVLDGVAVYTWDGTKWTPPSGNIEVATPSGVLEGVAQFSWDGTTWQPAAQASSEVPTPYGVLTGVALFNWSGTAWVASAGLPTLTLDFMTPGQIDSRVTFTRASTATYTDASGVIQTAAVNQPRWDYAGGVLRGLLIEEARTNRLLWTGDFSNAVWSLFSGATKGPVITTPAGVATGMTLNFAAQASSQMFQSLTINSGDIMSIWARANTSNSFTLRFSNQGDSPVFNLTSAWQRFTFVATTVSANVAIQNVGTTGGSIDIAMPQLEAGAFATSWVSTASAAATRAQDLPTLASGGWYSPPGGTWQTEIIRTGAYSGNYLRVLQVSNTDGASQLFTVDGFIGQYDDVGLQTNGTTFSLNVVAKFASSWAPGVARLCLNGGAVETSAALTVGYPVMSASPVFQNSGPTTSLTGYIRQLRYWPRVLSDAEMRQVTT